MATIRHIARPFRVHGILVACLMFAASAHAVDIRVDFAGNSITGNPGGNWNTLSTNNGSIANLQDYDTGSGSNISLAVTDSLSGPGNSNAGTWTGAPKFQSWIDPKATNDYFYLQSSNLVAQVVYAGSGLDPNKSYRVEILSSRSFGGDLTADYEINGNFSDNRNSDEYNAHYDGFQDHKVMTWRSVQPVGGQITFDMETDSAAVAGYLSAMRLSDTQSILFDLGRSSYQTSGNWNNAISLFPGHKVLGAVDAGGQPTGVSFSVIELFQDINGSGIASDAAGFPSSAQRDSFAADETHTGTVQIEGLRPGQTCDIVLFGSRQTTGGTNNRIAAYTIGGTTKTLLNEGNTTETVTFFDVAADKHGHVQIDTTAVDEFGYLGVVEVIGKFPARDAPIPASILFDFGYSGYPTDGSWNNVTSAGPGLQVSNAVNSLGQATTVDLYIDDAFSESNWSGETSNDAGFPISAQRDSLALKASNPTAQIRVEGLNPDTLYDFTFFGSRQDSISGYLSTEFQIGSRIANLENRGNTTDVAKLLGIKADAGGMVLLDVRLSPGGDYGYLGVMQITQVPEPSSLMLASLGLLGLIGLLVRTRRWARS